MRDMSGNFIIYLIGYIIVVIGVAYGMNAAGLGREWILPAVLILVGLGIVYALSRAQRDAAGNRRSDTPQQSTHIHNSPPADNSPAHPRERTSNP